MEEKHGHQDENDQSSTPETMKEFVFSLANEINELWRRAIERKTELPNAATVAALIKKYFEQLGQH